MRKLRTILFTGFMALSLASCSGLVDKITNDNGENEGGNEDSGNGNGGNSSGGGEGTNYQTLINNFENTIKDGFAVKVTRSTTNPDMSSVVDFGVTSEGFWSITNFDGSFLGGVYKKNGNGYLAYEVDDYGMVAATGETLTKEVVDDIYSESLGAIEGRLFSYATYMDGANIEADDFALGRSGIAYKNDLFGGPVTFTVDDELKINLKFKSVVNLNSESFETSIVVNKLTIGSGVELPLE